MNRKVVTLDVREDIRQGREPFPVIMRSVSSLEPDQSLLLIAPFEPVPLYGVLAMQGFSHETKAVENGEFEVLFTRS